MIFASLFLSGVTVVLPMEATSSGTELSLGEIAEVTGDDPAEVALVQAIDLGYTPSPGFTRLMHAHRIADEVGKAVPGIKVRIVGQPATRVRPNVETVAVEAIERAARNELANLFQGQDVSFSPRQEIQPVSVPAGGVAAQVRVRIIDPVASTGVISVPIQVLVDGAPYVTRWTSWQVERWETLPVLARPLRAGETIQPYHIEAKRVKVRAGRAKALPATMLTGAVAARELAAGSPVTDQDVHRPVVITLGDSVTLEVRKGGVRARTAAVALASAAIGDRVRVRAELGGQEHNAVVISRDLVRLDLGR